MKKHYKNSTILRLAISILLRPINSYLKYAFTIYFSVLSIQPLFAIQSLNSLFPIEHYDQTISHWINPNDADYDKALLNHDMQEKRMHFFYKMYFGESSPWDANYINKIFKRYPPDDLQTMEMSLIANFDNARQPADLVGYGVNFRPYDRQWIVSISNNINISQFKQLNYNADQRAIVLDNLYIRVLPTDDPHFYSSQIAGQGYPFDNLQLSVVWAGTPIYIVAETRDHAWVLVITPDVIGWVKTQGIAKADQTFINQWREAAKKHLVAITRTATPIIEMQGRFIFSAYVGSVFPGEQTSTGFRLMVPAANQDRLAVLKFATVSQNHATLMPLLATPHHFANLMNTLINRPYGWGGIYFYNDCSAELRSLMVPFGIWLPRHSSEQVSAGKMVEVSAATPPARIAYLVQNGHKFLTLVHIDGHILLYVGNYLNLNKSQTIMPMTYQNIWGLKPNPPIRRAIIGKAVLFPLLLEYPEDTSLASLAGRKIFQLSYLDAFPDGNELQRNDIIDLKFLMLP